MEYDLETFTEARHKECKELAFKRVKLQMEDLDNGDSRASYSYGMRGRKDSRSLEKRIREALMGTLGESIGSELLKCEWTKEMGQYKGNKNPDLTVTFKGVKVKCEARGTEREDSIIYRPHQDDNRPDYLLFAVGNLPAGPKCLAGHAFLRDLKKLAYDHPEWLGRHPGNAYFRIPFEYLSGDFSEFGEK